MKKLYFLFVITLFLAIPCAAQVIIVDANGTGDYPTIQDAINAANAGDIVELQPGTYTGDGNRDIDFLGKAITVCSLDPNNPDVVSATIIDCNGTEVEPHCGFTIQSGEDSNSIVSGLTITNGYGVNTILFYYYCGGGLFILDSSPTIKYCRIIGNSGSSGGGIYCQNSNSTISNCIIADNSSVGTSTIGFVSGGGILIHGSGYHGECSYPDLLNCTITGNSAADYGGGIFASFKCNIFVYNCLLWDNIAPEGHEIAIAEVFEAPSPYITISYCDIEGGRDEVVGHPVYEYNWLEGNIDMNPMFVNPGIYNYHLLSDSPCIDAGDPNYILAPGETDIDGEPRIFNDRIDMGADEFVPKSPLIEYSPVRFDFYAEECGANPESQILTIRNKGFGTLNWEITEDCDWLRADPNSGSSTGEVNEVTVSVDITALAGGTYDYILTISDPNAYDSPRRVRVSLVVKGPEIAVSSDFFSFCALIGDPDPPAKVLNIRNRGIGTLNWEIMHDCNWLIVDPNNGSSTGETDDVSLSVDTTGLNEGIYDCELTISDPCATNSPQSVRVRLNYLAVCFSDDHPSYSQWISVGRPCCWCYPRQCHGDADGLPYGKFNYYVSIPDLFILKKAWNKYAQELVGNEICADFDHLPYGKSGYRVSIPDLDILKQNWSIPGGPEPYCLPGNRNP